MRHFGFGSPGAWCWRYPSCKIRWCVSTPGIRARCRRIMHAQRAVLDRGTGTGWVLRRVLEPTEELANRTLVVASWSPDHFSHD